MRYSHEHGLMCCVLQHYKFRVHARAVSERMGAMPMHFDALNVTQGVESACCAPRHMAVAAQAAPASSTTELASTVKNSTVGWTAV